MTREDDPTQTSAPDTVVDPVDLALDATVRSPDDGSTPPNQIVVHTAMDGLPAPGERVGRYELGQVIGRGGMGVVYKARDPELDRPLAIKVVLPTSAGKRSQQRLLDEARAMAKLRHPAVVPVFDVGTTDRGVYVVMPLLAGGTLHDWASTKRRSWRDVLGRYLTAGRGLAAAHAAGLVHRDFKPRNVLLGNGGEVMVGDFGLAEDTLTPLPAGGPASVASPEGTPAYMAPEHAAGEPVDARADQFSFCVSLWEALHGERPTEAATRQGGMLRTAALPAVPADRRGAPGWLLSAVARGWESAPERRWPSMTALLDHIERRLRRPRRLAFGASLVVMAAAGAVGSQILPTTATVPCPDPRARLAGVWDAQVHASVERAFVSVAPALADDATARLRPIFDDYAEQWSRSFAAACKDTRVTQSQSPDMFDRRTLCLERRLGALAALTTVLRERPSRELVVKAVDAAANLPAIADCDRTEVLLAAPPRPGSPARRAEIAEVERELDAITALTPTGQVEEQQRRAETALAKARTLDYQPLVARALLILSRSQIDRGQKVDVTLQELARVAAAAHDDAMVALALISLVEWAATNTKPDEAAALEPAAEAAMIRAGATGDLRYRFETAVGLRLSRAQQYEAALARHQAAMKVADDARERAATETTIARLTLQTKGYVAARPLAEAALASMETAFGPNHPNTGGALEIMAQGLVTIGDYERAEALAMRVLALYEAVFGPAHPRLAPTLHTLTFIAKVTNRLPLARDYGERAMRVAEASNYPTRLANILAGHAEVVHQLDGLAAARPLFERAIATYAQAAGRQDHRFAQLASVYASALVDSGDCDTAEPLIDEALAVMTAKRPDLRPQSLFLQGRCLATRKRWPDAIRTFEQVEALCRQYGCEPIVEFPNLVKLGEALLETRRDRSRAIELLRKAKAGLVAKKMTTHLADLERLARNRGVRL